VAKTKNTVMELKNITNRVAVVADIPALVSLINSAYRGETSKQGWTTEADIIDGIRIDEAGVLEIITAPDADLHCFFAPDGQLLSCVYLQTQPNCLYLGMLTVQPGLQAAGLGRHMLHYAETVARQLGLPAIRMTVINTRTELIAWYERRGYQATGQTEPWIDGTHVGDRKQEIYFRVFEKQIYAAA
jgi:ribosomal protein S18 acetylase RimI-like enzyme